MKKNIAFVSLKAKFCKNICKMFCDRFELMFADIYDILQYNMVNQQMLNVAGQQYFNAEEQKVIKNVVTCENIGVNIDFYLTNKADNLNIIKQNCLVVYLKFTKEILKKYNSIVGKQSSKLLVAYDAEDKICQSIADVVVDVSGNNKTDIKNIADKIKKYYKI